MLTHMHTFSVLLTQCFGNFISMYAIEHRTQWVIILHMVTVRGNFKIRKEREEEGAITVLSFNPKFSGFSHIRIVLI